MEADRSITLSSPELRLSLKVLGFAQWDDLPLLDTEEPVEQRLMNALLHLIQKECFYPVGEQYAPTREFCQLIGNIGQAERVYCLYAQQYILAFFYEKGQTISVLSPDWGKQEQCRVAAYEGSSLQELQVQYSVISDQRIKTELKRWEKGPEEEGTYDLEQLGYFVGSLVYGEEAEE